MIAQVENHLEQARSSMAEADTFHQASVLWAIVKEDSASDGMFIRPPAPEELRPSLEHVSSDQAAFLLTHLTGARGQTFADLRKRSGYTPPPAVAAPRPGPTAQGRPKAGTNYFTKPVGAREILWAVVGGFGVLLLLFGLAAGDAGTLGCMTVLCGILVITALVKTIRYFLAYPKPSDRQMDDWLTSDVQNTVMPRALAQLRIDGRPAHEGGDLIVPAQIVVGVASPLRVFDVTRTLLHYAIFLGSDRRVRASYYDVLILFMTDKIVSAYQALLDTRTGHLLLDATQEHRYSDIAGVHSRTVPLNIAPNLRQQIPAETLVRLSAQHEFSLGIVNGNSLTVTVDLPSQQGGGVAWSNEQALSMIQRMIRGKKEA
ncbi:hypothetical protein HDA40_000182 [Hamadaea flava]|uniref:Uncharacterized protein n=1 Tax=Hamadaea flava TaxID=1742688 RepID=A0ABV8LXT6_9ACTN|nr:hypothetical protein [Hamadaea flava]